MNRMIKWRESIKDYFPVEWIVDEWAQYIVLNE